MGGQGKRVRRSQLPPLRNRTSFGAALSLNPRRRIGPARRVWYDLSHGRRAGPPKGPDHDWSLVRLAGWAHNLRRTNARQQQPWPDIELGRQLQHRA
jgi:hypothetical protein